MTTNGEWLDYLAHNAPDELATWFDAEHVETEERALDGDTAAQDGDSRELILTDLEKKTREWHDYDGNFMRIYSGVAYAQMKELLDRQAAVTEEKTRYKWVTASAEEIAVWRSKAEKLKEQVYELTAERDKLQEQLLIGWECECRLQAERDKFKEANGYHAAQYELASENCDRLQAQVDELQSAFDAICANLSIIATGEPNVIADIAIATIEALIDQCNEYRSKFGKCLDYADAIHALMDDEGMA